MQFLEVGYMVNIRDASGYMNFKDRLKLRQTIVTKKLKGYSFRYQEEISMHFRFR